MATALKKSETPKNEVAVLTPVSETAALLSMIQRMSTDPTVSFDRAQQAFAFYERVQANQARKAFDAAMAAAKAEIPVIKKKRLVEYEAKGGKTSYVHEDLGGIAEIIDPILAKHSLSYRYRTTSNPNEPVIVTCIIAHADGHSEETTLSAGRDDSGGKNAIQSIGSSVTYLQRYTLKAALGLAAAKDDDGATSDKTADEIATISSAQISVLETLIAETGSNLAAFLKMANAESVGAILAKDFEGLKTILEAKKRNGAAK